MISIEQAIKIIASESRDFGIVSIPLDQSAGRILRDPVYADRDFPPYDRVAMDGIAIRFKDYHHGIRKFTIAGMAAAGEPQKQNDTPGQCLEVMTGSTMPLGLDTVVPYEWIHIIGNEAIIQKEEVNFLQNIHLKGTDRSKGDLILNPGIVISPVDVGVCATVGMKSLSVSRLPKTVVISSGDELVDIDCDPLPHQIRKSNVYQIKTALQHYKAEVSTEHLADNLKECIMKMDEFISNFEILIISGGISKGKFDFIPQALETIGVEKLFHSVSQRPGKPFWFGKHPSGTIVFAFPGNPVSSFLCMQKYFIPWLENGLKKDCTFQPYAKLTEDVKFTRDLTYFLEVKLECSTSGELLARPFKGSGSGDLANLADADAFIELPKGQDLYKKETAYPVIPYRYLF